MSPRIGILLDQRVLQRALRGRPTIERLSIYRAIALDELGGELVVFSASGINVARRQLVGYVPTAKGWKRVRTAIPPVIHKRVLYRSSAPLRKLYRLRRRGVVFVNPIKIQDKRAMNAALASAPAVSDHIPFTQGYRWERLKAMLASGQSAILKPRVGSVGQGIIRAIPVDARRVQVTAAGNPRVIYRSRLRRWLQKRMGARRYLLQQYLSLAQYEGKPFDLRVPVQRDESGQWIVPGIVAKVARRHAFLTNMAQGGRAIPGETAIRAAFPGSEAADVIERVRSLAVAVARTVARHHPFAADMGLDIGVDQRGKPWLIEVNTRDQRYTFHEAGLDDEFRSLYRNPVMFCAYLSRIIAAGKDWRPQD